MSGARRLRERRRSDARAFSLGQRISAGSRDLSVFGRPPPRLGQGHKAKAAETDVAAATVHHRPQDPSLGARWIHDKVKSVSVGISAGLADVLDPDRRQGFFGMAARGPIRLHPTIYTTKHAGCWGT
jgi:hypothetical protein